MFALIVWAIFAKMMFGVYLNHRNINTPHNFPDPKFRAVVERWMKLKPGERFTPARAAKRQNPLICFDQGIRSLKGIEFFTRIRKIDCSSNNLDELDLSKNTGLELLYCSNNNLKQLDISNQPRLLYIECSNNEIESLNVSNHRNLKQVYCGNNNIKKLDFSRNWRLERLICSDNRLTQLTLSRSPRLRFLEFSRNQVTTINLTRSPGLQHIDCSENPITDLDISKNTQITDLIGSNMALKEIDLAAGNFHNLDISGNDLTILDCSNSTFINSLNASGNKITEIKMNPLNANTQFDRLDLSNNQLTEIPKFPRLNMLQSLDIRMNLLDESDIEDALQVKNQIPSQIVANDEENPNQAVRLQSGFLYSPQKNLDPYRLQHPETRKAQ